MKKTWYFGMALAFGVSSLPSISVAQYSPASYSNGALAPTGYALPQNYSQPVSSYPMQVVPPSVYGQPAPVTHVPQAMQLLQYVHPGHVPMGQAMAQVAAYPQETVPAPVPSVNAQQPVERGWVGPQNGQYYAAPAPQSVPMQTQPMNGGGVANAVNVGGQSMDGSCAGGCGGYGSMPAYGSVLAPTATAPMYGAPVYQGPVYGGPVYGGNIVPGAVAGGGWFSQRSPLPGKAFFAGGGALLMRRVDDHNVALSYSTAMPSENILGTRDARQYHLNGFEVFAGRYFNCGRNAILLNYWGLFPEDRTAQINAAAAPSAYRSRYHFNGIEMPTQTVYDWFDGARSHRIVRGSEYHNFEANLLGFAVGGAARTWTTVGPRRGAFGAGGYGDFGGYAGGGYGNCGTGGCGGYAAVGCGDCDSGSCADCGSCGSGCAAFTGPCGLTPNMCGSRLNWTWLGGFRWFRFGDDLQYAASDTDTMYDSIDDLCYHVNVRNDLVGFQLGSAGTYCLGRRFNVYALSKAGIYNNHSQFRTSIMRDGGPYATVNSANIYNGQSYMVESSKNNAAFLGEIGTGLGVRITRGWSANVGYRVIGAAGVATAVNNIPIEMIHLGNVADYNNTSSLLLHGVTLGGMYNF